MSAALVAQQVATLREQGFAVVRNFASPPVRQALRELALQHLAQYVSRTPSNTLRPGSGATVEMNDAWLNASLFSRLLPRR